MAAYAMLYALAVAVRLGAIVLPGYIHPDEVFQSQEVVAAALFGYDAFIPWEFADCAKPSRSIVPPCVHPAGCIWKAGRKFILLPHAAQS
jgi:phosphatidylinositol glycan class Z